MTNQSPNGSPEPQNTPHTSETPETTPNAETNSPYTPSSPVDSMYNQTPSSAPGPQYAGSPYAQNPQGAGPYQQANPQNPQNPNAYPQFPQGYPTQGEVKPEPQKNTLGLISFIVAIVGLVFACIPGALIVGWILLPVAFVLAIVSFFMKGQKRGFGIAGLVISILGTIVAAIVFTVVVVTAVDDAFNGEISTFDPDSVSGGTAPAGADTGDNDTREEPLPIGTAVSDDEWTVVINSVNLNATDEILAENQFNDVPDEGQVYIMANVTVTYTGTDPEGSIPFTSIAYVTPDGNTINTYDAMAVTPDRLEEYNTLYEGASESGNIAFLVPAERVEEGTLTVSPGMLSQTAFVAVQ